MSEKDKWIPLGINRPISWKEGDLTVTRSTAWSGPGCHNGCMVLLYTNEEGKLVKVEGDEEAPYNQGRLCSRCLDLPEVVNHPDRLQYPMKRVGARGENKWERISWDEAYDAIVREFTKIKERYGAEAVVFAEGTGRDIVAYNTRLAWSFDSPNPVYFLSGSACYDPRITACFAITGSFWVADCSQNFIDRYDNPEYKIPEVMLVWGNNPLESGPDGFYGHWVVDLMRRGTKLIVIDPRVTWLASKAEIHLQVRNGTDAALALGMINIIIQEDLYDHEFVENWCYGFDELADRAAQFSVERVSEITWIPKDKILAAARMFAKAENGTVQWGLAIDMNNEEAFPQAMAIIDLWSITGNLDVPGGMLPPHQMVSEAYGWGIEHLSPEQAEKRIGIKEYPLVGSILNLAQPDMTVKQMITGDPYPIKGAWLQTTNLLACCGMDPAEFRQALDNMDYVVVVDLFMTPTASACADIVLPAACFPERYGLRTNDGPQFGATINKCCQVGECKSDMQINMELGHRWNPEAWPWEDVRDMFTNFVQGSFLKGQTFQDLQQQAPVYKTVEYKKYEKGTFRTDGQFGFPTRTGRVELYSLMFADFGLDPLPYFEEPSMSPVGTPDLYEEYPLILSTGARDWMSFHSEHRQVPRLRALKKWPEVQVNPETAVRYGLADGDWVWIENPRGRAKRKVKVTEMVPEWMVMTDHGWWFPEQDGASPNNFGVWDVNINQLMQNKCGKTGFGTNAKSLLCKIYKVEEGK